jgi:hypothetical protein
VKVALLIPLFAIGCFRFTEDPMKTFTEDTGAAVDTGTAPDTAVADAPPTMCDRNGGFAVIDKAMTDLVPKIKADCRIDRFFATMQDARIEHMRDCMALQLGSIMRCSLNGERIKYPRLDRKGVQCKDMLGAHKTLGVHPEDFDGMIDDMLAVLADAKINADDLALVADILRFQRADIVNPGDAGRGDACASEASAPVDTGENY